MFMGGIWLVTINPPGWQAELGPGLGPPHGAILSLEQSVVAHGAWPGRVHRWSSEGKWGETNGFYYPMTDPWCCYIYIIIYMVTWIPSIYTLFVSIYTSTMDPMVDWPQRKSLANLQQIWDLLGTPGNLAGVGGKPCRANPKKPSLQNPEMTHVTIPMHNQQSLVVFFATMITICRVWSSHID